MEYTKFDQKTISIIKFSAIWSAVAAAISSLGNSLGAYYLFNSVYSGVYRNMMGIYGNYMPQAFAPNIIDIGALISAAIGGAIGGAVAGWVIAKFYGILMDWQKKNLGDKLNTFFKLLFWPSAIASLISIFLRPEFSRAGFNYMAIVIFANLLGVYIYAMMMDKNAGKLV